MATSRISNTPTEHYPFTLQTLPFDYSALEPHINRKNLQAHHQVFAKGYVNRLNQALAPYPNLYRLTLLQLLRNINNLPQDIQTVVHNNAGGVYNHQLYFSGLTPDTTQPSPELLDNINRSFISFELMRNNLKAIALQQFGSAWTTVVVTPSGRLQVFNTTNQDTSAPYNICPILVLDLWEHAYAPQYRTNRAAYFDNWFQVIDWEEVSQRYTTCLNGLPYTLNKSEGESL